jgi:HD-GYP domain-containing protein (c-di-GMP phosphodiesterase class II)
MENPVQLCYPVRTLDRTELLPAGTYLTPETMADLVRRARTQTFPTMRLMEYGTIATDLHSYCELSPYNQIFSNPKRMKDIFDTMRRVELAQPLLDIYGYFKANDHYTYRHILTVLALTLLLAQDFMENRQDLSGDVAALPNHDFGKICVPLEICKKTTLLTEREGYLLSHHAAAGYVLLSFYYQDSDHPAAITARDHHERCDGSGYPRGIVLRDRIVEIVAVGDVFDALISPRPYRPTSYDLRTALEEVTVLAESGAVSSDVVRALVGCNRGGQPSHADCVVSQEMRGVPPADNLYRGISPCRYQAECAREDDPKRADEEP